MSKIEDAERIAIELIEQEDRRRTGTLDLGRLGLKRLPKRLFALTHLRVLNLGPLRLGEEPVSDWEDRVPNKPGESMAGLAALRNLEILDLGETDCGDLGFLKGLTALQALNCWGTPVSDLTPIAGLSALQTLDCSATMVSNLAPIAELTALQILICADIRVSDLTPIRALAGLQTLDCWHTHVSDLTPIAGLSVLQTLDCSWTQVSDLTPIAGLSALQTLDCSETQVSDLTPIAGLSALQRLGCSRLRLKKRPDQICAIAALNHLTLYESVVPGVPDEILSHALNDNCLSRLRAYLAAAAAGTEPVTDVKVLILGNGRAGKTQLVRRLDGEPFEANSTSTHGVQIRISLFPALGDWPERRLRVWDFGGQDIYHGTHALFARASAIYVLVWSDDTNNDKLDVVDGVEFRNHPLPYWINYVGHTRRAGSVLVVKSKSDIPATGQGTVTLPDDGTWKPLRFSAATDDGLAELKFTIHAAAARLQSETGHAEIPRSWHEVQSQIETLQAQGVRDIEKEQFISLCSTEAGNPDHVLSYLHRCGIVFYRDGDFDGHGVFDKIILDQKWAIDAIYAVLDRERSVRLLKGQGGKFNRRTLADVIWDQLGHKTAEQRIFLNMMVKCGVCFPWRRHHGLDEDETIYIAPDLLPPRAEVAAVLLGVWGTDEPDRTAIVRFPFLHRGLIRGLIAWVGGQAGSDAIYWREGVCATEVRTQAKVLIEEDPDQPSIRISTKGGRSDQLLAQIVDHVRRSGEWYGLKPEIDESVRTIRPMSDPTETPDANFKHPDRDARQIGVSYAWADTENPPRDKIVDDLCDRARKKGIRILRDKNELGLRDSLREFADTLAGSDRLFVILTAKYLKSFNCMRELSWIWRRCKQTSRASDFMAKVWIIAEQDVQLSNSHEVLAIVEWWRHDLEKLKEMSDKNRDAMRGTLLETEIREREELYRDLGEILPLVYGYLRPTKLADLIGPGLDGV